MKIEFIKRGAATRLILLFAGWSTDARYYLDCIVDGWDTAVVSDYRDMTMPELPQQYSTVYVFAYSLGVWAASVSKIRAAVRIAICGSPFPVSDRYGIPEAVYDGTLHGLNDRSLMKFHLRMAGDKVRYEAMRARITEKLDIEILREELAAIREKEEGNEIEASNVRFDRVYLADEDRIFPYSNLKAYWSEKSDAEIISLNTSHAVDIGAIVKECLPDLDAIGTGFARAAKTYNDNAVIQQDICMRMSKLLVKLLPDLDSDSMSLLEIGAGSGLLTEEWRKLVRPTTSTFVDLTEMPVFGISEEERYIRADAERWLEESEEKFDLILSASTIQWFADPVKFLTTVKAHLKPSGVGIISTFVKGNLRELDNIRPCPLIYHNEEEYLAAGVSDAECWQHTMRFDSAKEMLMHLKLTGVSPSKIHLKDLKKSGSPKPMKMFSQLPNELTYRPMILVIRNR